MTPPALRPRPALPGAARIGLIAGGCLALTLLLGVSWYGYREGIRASQARASVTHTLLVLQSALELENAAITMEANHRGFLVTGDDAFELGRDRQHRAALEELGAMGALVADNPVQSARLARVQASLAKRHDLMMQSSRVARDGGIAAARLNFRAHGDGSIDPLRALLRELRGEEQDLLAARNATSNRNSVRHDRVLVYGTGLALLVLVVAGVLLLRQLARIERVGARLAESGKRLELTCESSRIGTWDVDLASGRLRASPRLEQVVGRPPDGEPWTWAALLEAVHPEDRATLDAHFRAATGQDDYWGMECRVPVPGDSPRWIFISGRAWRHVDGVAQRMLGTATDITDRKLDEQRIAVLNQELTDRSRALEESNREMEAFSYSVSHDLRAPLRHIDGYARMLIEDLGEALEPEPRRYLRNITDSARRMGQLIDDLLSLSRLGRKTVAHDAVDMRTLAAEALEEAGHTDAAIEWGDLPPASGDRSLLKQVWVNLLSNAIKYSGPRGADGRIAISGEALPGGASAYTVRDNGVGFDMRYADKLFGVFQRLHPQDKFEGTGVGLAITQRIVSRHGGRISANAEPDRGATFRFELPATQEMA